MKERTAGGDLLAGSSYTNDDALAPALVASLEGGTHDLYVARAVEGVVAAAVGHLNELVLDSLAAKLGRVDEVRGTELPRPLLLSVVNIHHNNLAGLPRGGTLNNGETDATGAKDGYVIALLHIGRDGRGAVAGGDTAAEKAGSVHGGVGLNGDDGDVGDNGVLGEGRGSHEVQQVLALALEPGGAVGHDTLTLRRADLAAQVRLARLAELAFLAFGGTIRSAVSLPSGKKLGRASNGAIYYRATTVSPGLTFVTPSPTDSTIPAPSCPRTMGNAPSGSLPDSVYASAPLLSICSEFARDPQAEG